MTRGAFVFGLVLSALFHTLALSLPPRATASPPTPQVIPVVETVVDAGQTSPPSAAPTEPVPAPKPVTRQPSPPELPLETVVAPASEATPDTGDLAGRDEAKDDPMTQLRIDWGEPAYALAIVRSAAMTIVVLDGANSIVDEVTKADPGWQRQPFRSTTAARYSNRLRIVDGVPGFASVRRAIVLAAGERLAVAVPVDVERLLEAAQREAAVARSLRPGDLRLVGGRFVRRGDTLDFETTFVEPRHTHGRTNP